MSLPKDHPAFFFLAYLIPLSLAAGPLLGQSWAYGATIIIAFGLIPAFDFIIGLGPEEPAETKDSALYSIALILFPPIAYLSAYGALEHLRHQDLSLGQFLAFAISLGLSNGGIGITISHELMHRKDSVLCSTLSKALLVLVGYGHFQVEHLRGHHLWVATPSDPASAPQGMNVYRFWLRSIMGSYRSAYRAETRRTQTQSLAWANNQVYFLAFLSLLMWGLASSIYGLRGLALLLLQALTAILLLESINYVEHYGLRRKELRPGRFEKVNPLHSWNSNHWLSNILLFRLQRHSAHHAEAHIAYPSLRHCPESPQLPFGYPTMVLCALWPRLWFKLMDPLIQARAHA